MPRKRTPIETCPDCAYPHTKGCPLPTWTHGTAYRRGCRCDACTTANTARVVAYHRKVRDETGTWPGHTRVVLEPCSGCGEPMKKRGNPDARHRGCHIRPLRSTITKRARALRKAEQAAQGTTGQRLWIAGPCEWCGCMVPPRTGHPNTYCTIQCRRRMKRMRRRGLEHGAPGEFTWSQVMRVFKAFDHCCAYCDQKIPATDLEPDHVIPLSRGGMNSISNILPSCRLCNKRDLLLDEWRSDRERRHMPPRITTWRWTDSRIKHLAVELVAA